LRVAQTELAVATKDDVDALEAQERREMSHEYSKTMEECCDERNEFNCKICAVTKIRGELYKMKGQNAFITDCEVSDFKGDACSQSRGGGILIERHSILKQPYNGMDCPPLELQDCCTVHPCPIGCRLGEWEGWSACSAECGGGVRERMRPVLQQAKYDGGPCEAPKRRRFVIHIPAAGIAS